MAKKEEFDRDFSGDLYFRKHLAVRKRIQTAEGWRRTIIKMREEKRKSAKARK